jgi:hypothetical protein
MGSKSLPTPDVLRDIFFVDENNGWLVCEVNVYDLKTKDQPRAYLMHTVDGGENWRRVDIKGVDVDARLVRAVFSRGGRGWAFGEGGQSSRRVTQAPIGHVCSRRRVICYSVGFSLMKTVVASWCWHHDHPDLRWR